MKQPNVLNLTCPAIPVVRIGFVGLGNRGILALERYMHLEGIEVKALCDLRPREYRACRAYLTVSTALRPRPMAKKGCGARCANARR